MSTKTKVLYGQNPFCDASLNVENQWLIEYLRAETLTSLKEKGNFLLITYPGFKLFQFGLNEITSSNFFFFWFSPSLQILLFAELYRRLFYKESLNKL